MCDAPGTTTPPAAVQQLAAGQRHTCARLADGTVWCWGMRGHTLVDNDVLGPVACPVATRVDDLESADDLIAGGVEACVVRKDGSVRCGSVEQWSFADRGGLRDARRLLYWSNDLCAITRDATLRCTRDAITAEVAGFAAVEQVAASTGGQPCALSKGTVTCRYYGHDALGTDIAAIESDARGVVAITKDGALVRLEVCGTAKALKLCRSSLASTLRDAASIASSGLHTCVVQRSGRVACRHCTSPTCTAAEFAEVASVTDAIQIAVGPDHACAVRRNGQVVCWGSSDCGEAGGDVPAHVACRGRHPPRPATPIVWGR